MDLVPAICDRSNLSLYHGITLSTSALAPPLRVLQALSRRSRSKVNRDEDEDDDTQGTNAQRNLAFRISYFVILFYRSIETVSSWCRMRVRLKPLLSALRSRPSPTSHLQPWLTPLVRDASICKRFQSQQSAPSAAEPLQILYCGSDDFSCANLRALHDEHVKSPGLIESIDVVVRPGKRVGRGNKKTRHREFSSIIC